MSVIRLIFVVWLFGFVVLALAATSTYLFSSGPPNERSQRWSARLVIAALWPIAMLSSAGRARLRGGGS
jgi:hypothetical protein